MIPSGRRMSAVHQRVVARAEAEVRQVEEDARLVQETHDDPLVAAARRDGADADVEALAGDLLRDAAVLREALLGDVERALDLDAADDAVHEGARRAARDVELAVDAVADDDLFLFRLDVDVARALLHRLEEERVDPADDRRLVVGVEDVARRLLVDDSRRRSRARRSPASRLVDAVDRVLDLIAAADHGLDRLAEDDAQVVERLRCRTDRRRRRARRARPRARRGSGASSRRRSGRASRARSRSRSGSMCSTNGELRLLGERARDASPRRRRSRSRARSSRSTPLLALDGVERLELARPARRRAARGSHRGSAARQAHRLTSRLCSTLRARRARR